MYLEANGADETERKGTKLRRSLESNRDTHPTPPANRGQQQQQRRTDSWWDGVIRSARLDTAPHCRRAARMQSRTSAQKHNNNNKAGGLDRHTVATTTNETGGCSSIQTPERRCRSSGAETHASRARFSYQH
ncbi:unnamed protein product [Lampetra fluviatilis]